MLLSLVGGKLGPIGANNVRNMEKTCFVRCDLERSVAAAGVVEVKLPQRSSVVSAAGGME